MNKKLIFVWAIFLFILPNTQAGCNESALSNSVINCESINWIEKDVLDNNISVQNPLVPEPATVIILGIGAFLMSCESLKKRAVHTAF